MYIYCEDFVNFDLIWTWRNYFHSNEKVSYYCRDKVLVIR